MANVNSFHGWVRIRRFFSQAATTIFLLVIAGPGSLRGGWDSHRCRRAALSGGYLALTAAELSIIVAAMMLVGVFVYAFVGMLADWNRPQAADEPVLLIFVVAIPMIALSMAMRRCSLAVCWRASAPD